MRFEPNEDGIKEIGDSMARATQEALEEVVGAYPEGGNPEDVRSALDQAAKRRGLNIRWADETVAAIAEARPMSAE